MIATIVPEDALLRAFTRESNNPTEAAVRRACYCLFFAGDPDKAVHDVTGIAAENMLNLTDVGERLRTYLHEVLEGPLATRLWWQFVKATRTAIAQDDKRLRFSNGQCVRVPSEDDERDRELTFVADDGSYPGWVAVVNPRYSGDGPARPFRAISVRMLEVLNPRTFSGAA